MQDLKPTVWIGKQGCTGTMIEEIVSQLKKRKLKLYRALLEDAEHDAGGAIGREDFEFLLGP